MIYTWTSLLFAPLAVQYSTVCHLTVPTNHPFKLANSIECYFTCHPSYISGVTSLNTLVAGTFGVPGVKLLMDWS